MDEKKAETASTSVSPSPGSVPSEVILQRQIEDRFAVHKVSDEDAKAMEEIRAACKNLALLIVSKTKIGRDQSSAITHLDVAMFHANAAIARKGK